jgi:hypothetical protein
MTDGVYAGDLGRLCQLLAEEVKRQRERVTRGPTPPCDLPALKPPPHWVRLEPDADEPAANTVRVRIALAVWPEGTAVACPFVDGREEAVRYYFAESLPGWSLVWFTADVPVSAAAEVEGTVGDTP